ncbi:MAG TPA: hypothetical protein VFL74_07575 [Sphingomicrobium sp.]|nr:hypothetical protein [Sphingomicrobium sp.]
MREGYGEHAATTFIWFACLFTAAAIQFPLALNHDAAWHFEISFRLLAGDRLGKDIFDINPPMSAWLFLLPASIAKAGGFSPAVVFKAFAFLVCSVSYFWTLALIDSRALPRSRRFFAFVLAAALLIMPGYDFGQREHLAGALALPYVALAIRRAQGRSLYAPFAVFLGIVAAVGICIKPYFLAVPLCVEIWLCVQRRSFASSLRPEPVSIGLFGFAYLAAVWIWAPDYYLRVVPDALVSYGGFDNSWPAVLFATANIIALPLICALLAALAWGGDRTALPAQAFFSAALGFLIAALLQKKGWNYQFLPVAIDLIVGAAALYACRGEMVSRRLPAIWGSGLALILALTMPVISFLGDGHSPTGTTARVAALEKIFERYSTPRDSIFAFITSPRDIQPAVLQSGRHWAASSGAMLYLPAEVNLSSGEGKRTSHERIDLISERENRDLLDRLARKPPAIIVVDNKRRKLGIADPHFSYIAYFSRYPAFRALWADYREIEPIGGFRVFVRKSSAGAVLR